MISTPNTNKDAPCKTYQSSLSQYAISLILAQILHIGHQDEEEVVDFIQDLKTLLFLKKQ